MAYRSSAGDLGVYDDPPRRPERWDREKFERFSRRGPDDRESFRFEERDRSGPRSSYRDIEIDDRTERRGPRSRVEERDRFFEEDRYSRPTRARPAFLDDPTPSEVANRALAPYRRQSIAERDLDVQISTSRRPARPQFIRRQSSLDTFDRRPLPRYGDREREEYRPPTGVPIPLPIRERRRSPPRYREEEFEEIRYRDVEPDYREEDYRDVHIHREKSRVRRSESRRPAPSAKSSTSSFEEVSPVRQTGKKGKTRMPKRLVRKEVIVDLGYPFEEEDDFIIVRRALEKDQIDEIIKISESYKEKKVTYRYEDTEEIEPPFSLPPPPGSVHGSHAPPPPPSMHGGYGAPPPPPPPEFMHAPPPPPPQSYAPPPPPSAYHGGHSVRSPSPPRTLFEERIEESERVAGPLVALQSDHRSQREVEAEIRALEAERRLVKLERETDYEFVERREPRREVVRVEKDRKGKRNPDPKILAAMMATLS